MIYLDACILIYAVEDGGPLGSLTRDRLRRIDSTDFAISPLVMHEVLVDPLRSQDDARIEEYMHLFSAMTVLDLDLSVFVHAAQLRADTRGLKTPDALHLAAAQLAGCTALWTNDRRLAAASGGLAIDVIHDEPAN